MGFGFWENEEPGCRSTLVSKTMEGFLRIEKRGGEKGVRGEYVLEVDRRGW